MDWGTKIISNNAVTSVVNATTQASAIDIRATFGKTANGVIIALYGTDGDNEDCGFDLYAYKEGPAGPAVPVFFTAATAVILGTYDCTKYPVDSGANSAGDALTGFWVDTISGTDYWPAGVTIANSGNNAICTISFDLMGFRYLLLHYFDGADPLATAGAIITAY